MVFWMCTLHENSTKYLNDKNQGNDMIIELLLFLSTISFLISTWILQRILARKYYESDKGYLRSLRDGVLYMLFIKRDHVLTKWVISTWVAFGFMMLFILMLKIQG